MRPSQALLEHGADVNWQNSNRYTALMRAALRGHSQVVEYLLSSGADPAIQNARRGTALQLAKNKGSAEVLDVFRRFSTGEGKLHKAAPISTGISTVGNQHIGTLPI